MRTNIVISQCLQSNVTRVHSPWRLLSVFPSVRQSVYISVCMYICPSACQSVYVASHSTFSQRAKLQYSTVQYITLQYSTVQCHCNCEDWVIDSYTDRLIWDRHGLRWCWCWSILLHDAHPAQIAAVNGIAVCTVNRVAVCCSVLIRIALAHHTIWFDIIGCNTNICCH